MQHPAESIVRENLRLRRWQWDDTYPIHRVVNAALDHLSPWMPWAANGYDLAAANAFLSGARHAWETSQSYAYAIIVADTLVGGCALERRIGPDALEIGYWLHPSHTSRGLATASTAALIDEAFSLPDIQRVQIWHDAANTASSMIPRKLAFTEIARRTPPREPLTSGEIGIDVINELHREDARRD